MESRSVVGQPERSLEYTDGILESFDHLMGMGMGIEINMAMGICLGMLH